MEHNRTNLTETQQRTKSKFISDTCTLMFTVAFRMIAKQNPESAK